MLECDATFIPILYAGDRNPTSPTSARESVHHSNIRRAHRCNIQVKRTCHNAFDRLGWTTYELLFGLTNQCIQFYLYLWLYAGQGLREKFFQGVRRSMPGPQN